MPLKEISTQDAYLVYGKNWILPRWGCLLLEDIKTIEVERWLRTAEVAAGTKAKIKCVMSAVFSHAVRWEFCGHNPISSGIPVGTGGQRGPSTGVRVSAKRQKSPLVLSPEEVILGLAQLEFRDQILVFLDGALGIRQGELGVLHWLDCDFNNMNFSVQHSYYWRRGGHLKSTKTEASAKLLPMHPSLKLALLEWRSVSLYNQPGDFVFPSERLKGKKPLDLASVLKKKIQPAFKRIGITGVGWHTFRHTVGTMLAEMGEHQLMIRDYLRHSDLHVTNKYLQATTKSKRLVQGKLVDAILPGGVLSGSKSTLVNSPEKFASPDYLMGGRANRQMWRRLLDPNGPRSIFGVPCKPFKGMAGTTGLEPAASAVTAGRSPAGPRRIRRLGVRLSATVGFIGQRRLVLVQRFVQPSSPCRARAKT
jgi:integrase